MRTDAYSTFSQGTFLFEVGESLEPFHLHATLAADRSPVLNSMMTVQMKEVRENTAQLPKIDPSIFLRFAEFIYCGDYTAPGPECTKIQKTDLQAAYNTITPLPLPSRRKVVHKRPPDPSTVKLGEFGVFPLPSVSIKTFPTISKPCVADEGVQQDYTEAAYCHARVCVMADYLQVQVLKDLAVRKMHETLEGVIKFENKYIKNIIGVLEYCYENTTGPESSKDRLCDLMTHYVAWDFQKIMGNADFKAGLRLKIGEPFIVDICEKVSRRL